uniref:anhydro-N-acetylmuramic acid kinase n=1 Tax=uncultured Paracoccus sp. TaxID=189685 RepID=UPI0025E9312A
MIRVLGMMSGTSMDGVDAALIDTDGVRIGGFGRSGFRTYSDNESGILHASLGQWPNGPGVAEAAGLSVASHAALASDFPEAELIGYHGQTLAHDPQGRGTHQAGDGAALARATARPVVWDFRTEDVRRGGEGAPLAPFFHWACAAWAVAAGHLPPRPVAFLNLGGVGNITWVDPAASAPEASGACLAFDTGPANAPINDLMRRRLHQSHDRAGALAASGRADDAIVADFLRHPWFDRPPPKSLDRDQFA